MTILHFGGVSSYLLSELCGLETHELDFWCENPKTRQFWKLVNDFVGRLISQRCSKFPDLELLWKVEWVQACTPRKARRRWPFANWRLWLERRWFGISGFHLIWIVNSVTGVPWCAHFNFYFRRPKMVPLRNCPKSSPPSTRLHIGHRCRQLPLLPPSLPRHSLFSSSSLIP